MPKKRYGNSIEEIDPKIAQPQCKCNVYSFGIKRSEIQSRLIEFKMLLNLVLQAKTKSLREYIKHQLIEH